MDEGSRIALIDVDGQLATVAADGSRLTRLTHGERVFQFPAWAPDNRMLAAIGGGAGGTGVYLIPAITEATPQRLRSIHASDGNAPIYLSWSPNGAILSILAAHPQSQLALFLAQALDDTIDQLTPVLGGQPCFWHWRADSHGLLAHVDLGRRTAQLTHVRWQTLDQPTLQPIDVRPGSFQAPGISHDGHLLAYAQMTAGGDSQLVVAGRERRIVIGAYDGLIAFGWSPTGDQLAFIHPLTANEHFYGPLHIWHGANEQVQRLTNETVVAFFWSPDGRRIAFVAAPNEVVAQRNHDGRVNGYVGKAWPFAEQRSAPVRLTLSVIELSSGLVDTLLNFTPVAPFVNQYLPFFDQYAKSHPIWSPDGSALVLPVYDNGQPVIQVIPVEGRARTVAAGYMATWSW